jgi:hypothetical protein
MLTRGIALALFAALVVAAAPASAAPTDDHYLAGYAVAVLERELDVHDAEVEVRDGVVTVRVVGRADRERAVIRDTLMGTAQFRDVDVTPTEPVTENATPAEPPAHAALATEPAVVARTAPVPRAEVLPRGELFRPLLADPKWPRFSATYRYYIDDTDLRSVGSANFGATIPLYRHSARPAGRWEAGLQAGVFSIFDLDAASKDLINADYFVALLSSYAVDDFAAIGRVFHQSSHVGDEFLLRGRVKNRVNLSYEALDLKLSYDLWRAVRLYGGASYLFDRDPASLEPWALQYGVEVTSPWSLDPAGTVIPVVAVDFQNQEESNWSTQYSLLAGLELERVRIAGSALLLGVEWFRGHSPNGQFYRSKVEWTGIGLHLFF